MPQPSPRERLARMRPSLLDLHRLLLESERRRYEAEFGRVSATELLGLAMRDPRFSWLQPVSAIIVRLDELAASADDLDAAAVGELANQVRTLLRPVADGTPFEQRYDQAVQDDPAVLLAHRAVMQALQTSTGTSPVTVH